MNKKLTGWLAGVEGLAFTVLEGSMFTVGLVVGPALFKVITSRDLAGRAFGRVLETWLWFGLGSSLLLLLTALATLFLVRPFSRLLLARAILLAPVVALIAIFGLILNRITTLQNSLTKPLDEYPTNVNPRLEIDQLHKLSTNLLSAAVFLALAWFVVSIIALMKARAAQTVADQSKSKPSEALAV